MNTEKIQLSSLPEAINPMYQKKIILTGWKGMYALQNAFVPWPKSSTDLIFKDKTQTVLAPFRIYARITSVDLNIALQPSLSSIQLHFHYHPWLAG